MTWLDGMAVIVGPMTYGGICGVVDWSAVRPFPATRDCPAGTMLDFYGPELVPVRHGLTVCFHNQRWIEAL